MVLVALGVPLAVNLNQRATLELETEALIQAQGIASTIGAAHLKPSNRDVLGSIVRQAAEQVGGRVIVVDAEGILLADSLGRANLGEDYANGERPELDAAVRGRPDSEIRFSRELGIDLLATAVPIQDDGVTIGAVRITKPMSEVRAETLRAALGLIAVGGAGLAAGLILAWALAGSLARPLRRLANASRRLGAGDLAARAEHVGGAAEIEQLTRSFDEMADRLERTVRAQREFVANASHQLRTPLTAMKLRLEAALGEIQDPELRRHLEAADREVDRLAEIVERLLVMARQIEEGQPTEVDLGQAVQRAIERWGERAERLGASLLWRGEGGRAQGNPADVDQILDNLLDNAIAYAPGEIVVETGRDGDRMILAVRDHGPGIPEDERERVTDRFYRGAGAPPGGSGLGLAIARELAEKWGGSLRVLGAEGGGTRVEVRLRPARALTEP
ncbi:MAG: two-component sensor histidine kinase [Actinomycetota bacterium]|nr:MAG: two-component sensor histidine kinase [Actinomycetota bacterium]